MLATDACHSGHGHDDPLHAGDDGRWEFSLTLEERGLCVLGAASLLGVGWLLESLWSSPLLAELAFWIALGFGVWSFVEEILERPLGVATLMAVASIGAAMLPQGVHEGATLAVLFSVSELLIHATFDRTRRGLRGLLDLVPVKVTVEREGRQHRIDPFEIVVGDLMVIKPGERLATDGRVVSGSSLVDLSAVTGEPVPVEAYAGCFVYAGGVNGAGALVVEASVEAGESSLGRLVALLQQAAANRGVAETVVDRIAAWLVPLAVSAAGALFAFGAVTGDLSRWAYRSLLVLVALSPCAFVIALPVTVLASVGAAGRAGVLIKGGAVLEALARVRLAALDKTGTLTACRPRVLEVLTAPGHDEAEVVAVAVALESQSEHPLAGAVLALGQPSNAASDVRSVPGRGLVGVVAGRTARLGCPEFVLPGPLQADVGRLQQLGATVVVIEHDGQPLGLIAVRDELRPEAPAAVAGLRAAGIERVVMLTGDNRLAAETLGRVCGIDEVRAELLPEEKLLAVAELKRRAPVLMVGDGINDAPALASAEVGVVMGKLGADLAVDAGGAALMGEDLRRIPELLCHARRTQRIVRQGLFVSGMTILALTPLAATGTLRLAPMVLFHELSGVLIILNGLRAGRTGAFEHHRAAIVAPDERPGQSRLTPRRLAVGLAAAAILVGLGGAALHLRAGRPNPYARWAQAAGPILGQAAALAEGYEQGSSCPRRERIDRLAVDLPSAPEDEMQAWVRDMFDEMRRQEAACRAADHHSVALAGNSVNERISQLLAWAQQKSDSGHQH